jgi:hypothetical protein
MSDTYVTVTATLLDRRPAAVRLDAGNGGEWVPRSCIHGADECEIDDADIGDEVTLRMFEWVANKKGFV